MGLRKEWVCHKETLFARLLSQCDVANEEKDFCQHLGLLLVMAVGAGI
jgi:hypothetical protein